MNLDGEAIFVDDDKFESVEAAARAKSWSEKDLVIALTMGETEFNSCRIRMDDPSLEADRTMGFE